MSFRYGMQNSHLSLFFKKLQKEYHVACCNWANFDTWQIFMGIRIITCHHLGLIDVKVGTLWIGRDYRSTF